MAVTTCDLGNAIAVELAGGEYVKGVVAQLPYDQGRAAALVSLLALVGRSAGTPACCTAHCPVKFDGAMN